MNAKVKGTAFALFGGACWGLSSVVGKLLFDMRGMNAEWLVTARLVFWWIYHALLCGLSEKR